MYFVVLKLPHSIATLIIPNTDMQMRHRMARAALCGAILMAAAHAVADVVPPQGDPPLMMIRLRGPHTADDAQ